MQVGPGLHAAAQLVQKPPVLPHCASPIPEVHWPFAPEQQPPLHGVTPANPHRLVHVFPCVSHPYPPIPARRLAAKQSFWSLQPHL